MVPGGGRAAGRRLDEDRGNRETSHSPAPSHSQGPPAPGCLPSRHSPEPPCQHLIPGPIRGYLGDPKVPRRPSRGWPCPVLDAGPPVFQISTGSSCLGPCPATCPRRSGERLVSGHGGEWARPGAPDPLASPIHHRPLLRLPSESQGMPCPRAVEGGLWRFLYHAWPPAVRRTPARRETGWAGPHDRQLEASFAEEAVNEVKRQAMSELQKAVSDAERKAHELISTERAKMERALAEARRQASEDALSVVNQQEDSSEVGLPAHPTPCPTPPRPGPDPHSAASQPRHLGQPGALSPHGLVRRAPCGPRDADVEIEGSRGQVPPLPGHTLGSGRALVETQAGRHRSLRSLSPVESGQAVAGGTVIVLGSAPRGAGPAAQVGDPG